MNRTQIKKAFYDENKPLMKNYILILVALLLVVVLYFVFTDYQAIAQVISDGEAPPALPDVPEGAGSEEFPVLPEAGGDSPPQFPY